MSSSSSPASSASTSTSLPSVAMSGAGPSLSSVLSSASLAALPASVLGAHTLGSMFSHSVNARSSGTGIGGVAQVQQKNYFNNVNYAAAMNLNVDNAHGRMAPAVPLNSSSPPSTGATPLPAPSPASYLFPAYTHAIESSPPSTTPYPLPYPYASVNAYYPNVAPTGGVAFNNNTLMYSSNAQNRAAVGMSSSGSNNNIRSMQSFDPIPSAYEASPATTNAAFQSIARSQSAHTASTLAAPQAARRVSQQDVYSPFNQFLDPTVNDPSPPQSQGQSTPFYPNSAAAMAPSPLQSSAASSAAAVYQLNQRLSAANALQTQTAADSASSFDSYSQGTLLSSFPYRVSLPMGVQSGRMHSPQQMAGHLQTAPAPAYLLQSSAAMNDEIRSRKRKNAADNSDTSTSDNTPGDFSTSPISPLNSSPFVMANMQNHQMSHAGAPLHPQLHQSLLSQAHAHRHAHSLLHPHPHGAAHHFQGHQPPLHPLAQAAVYNAAHASFINGVPHIGGASGELLPSPSVAVLSELTDDQLEQEAKFVLGDRQCELMTVMLREVGSWHRRQYWAGKLKESNDGAWRDFLNIARNRSLDLQTLEHHWQSRVCNPFDGHNMDKFNRRLAYLGLQVEWRRGTQKSEYRIIRIARMMPIDGSKPQTSDPQLQAVHGKKLNYRSAMWYKRAKRASDAEESAEEDANQKDRVPAPAGRADSDSHEDSNDEEVMAIQQHSGVTQEQPQQSPPESASSLEPAKLSNRTVKKFKSSSSALDMSSSSSEDDGQQSDSSFAWSPQSSSVSLSYTSSSHSLSSLVDWSVDEMSDFLFDAMKAQVHAQTHSSDWHSPADWSLLLKQHNVSLWDQFVQRCRSRGCAGTLLNRTWRRAFRRPFYENLLRWNTRLAHLSDPFVIEEHNDPQTQRKHFRIAALVKIEEDSSKKTMLIESSNEKKTQQEKSCSSGSASESAQFLAERSTASPFDSSALDSQKPMDHIIHHPMLAVQNPATSAFASTMASSSASLFNPAPSDACSSSSVSSPSSSSSSAGAASALFVCHPPPVAVVSRLASTPTDMHVATSSAAITSESRAAIATKLFVF